MKHIYIIIVARYIPNVARETKRNTNIIQETDRLTERLLADNVMMPSGNGKRALVGIDIAKGLDRPLEAFKWVGSYK